MTSSYSHKRSALMALLAVFACAQSPQAQANVNVPALVGISALFSGFLALQLRSSVSNEKYETEHVRTTRSGKKETKWTKFKKDLWYWVVGQKSRCPGVRVSDNNIIVVKDESADARGVFGNLNEFASPVKDALKDTLFYALAFTLCKNLVTGQASVIDTSNALTLNALIS